MGFRDFLVVDIKDLTNWIAILIAIPLLYWGITTIIKGLAVK